MGAELILLVYGLSLLVLSTFGLNRYILVSTFRRHLRHDKPEFLEDRDAPRVTIQLPIFNELNVVERLIRSACAVDYPRHLLEVQVLDDSTDETLELTRRLVRSYRKKGFDIVHVHREDRTGFKGGALAHGLELAKGEFVAVFDADFVIPRDFLRRMLPHFTPEIGMVQARWTYLNDDYSLLTRAAALGLDGHFVVEQSARYWGGLFLNFNGTAGIWRKQCILDAGGWQHDTLTEDLDLSYRAQLAGWRFKYLWDVTCASEIPADIHSMKAQQFRWTKGSMETARKVLKPLWRAPLPLWVKIQGTLHLLGNIVFPFFLTVGVLNLPVVLVANAEGLRLLWPVSAYFLFTLFGTFQYYWTAQKAVNMPWRRRALYFPLFLGASIGMCLYNTQAAIEGLLGRKSPFVRTPKFSLIGRRGTGRGKRYRVPVTWTVAGEVLLGLYTATAIAAAIYLKEYGALPFLCLFAFGYLMVATLSLRHLGFVARSARSTRGSMATASSDGGRLRRRRTASRSRRSSVPQTFLVLVAMPWLVSGCRQDSSSGEESSTGPSIEEIAFPSDRPAGFSEVELAQRQRGAGEAPGAYGTLWYRPAGETFDWFVQAQGLTPDRAFRLVLEVDGKSYAIASLRTNHQGVLRGYGTLEAFQELTCGEHWEFDRPKPLAGLHQIRVAIQDNGAKRSGGKKRGLPMASRGEELPCSGNGDHSYDYRLTDASAVQFEGHPVGIGAARR